jgi:hypothetical protein
MKAAEPCCNLGTIRFSVRSRPSGHEDAAADRAGYALAAGGPRLLACAATRELVQVCFGEAVIRGAIGQRIGNLAVGRGPPEQSRHRQHVHPPGSAAASGSSDLQCDHDVTASPKPL